MKAFKTLNGWRIFEDEEGKIPLKENGTVRYYRSKESANKRIDGIKGGVV